MSINTEVERIKSAKEKIKTAITEKGVAVPEETKLDGYSDLIKQIKAGGVGQWEKVKDIEFTMKEKKTIIDLTTFESNELAFIIDTPRTTGRAVFYPFPKVALKSAANVSAMRVFIHIHLIGTAYYGYATVNGNGIDNSVTYGRSAGSDDEWETKNYTLQFDNSLEEPEKKVKVAVYRRV